MISSGPISFRKRLNFCAIQRPKVTLSLSLIFCDEKLRREAFRQKRTFVKRGQLAGPVARRVFIFLLRPFFMRFLPPLVFLKSLGLLRTDPKRERERGCDKKEREARGKSRDRFPCLWPLLAALSA